ncbi:MAG TPA: histidine phosphatase family protein [Planctomycetota bacterium]|nr:histidine phosphatase family protein [Planctomycetota bacterium]
MKRKWLLGAGLFLAGWLAARLPFEGGVPALAGGQTCVDGDVNQDGAVNVTDPVHLLSFLYRGGQAPVTCSAAANPVSIVFVTRHAERQNQSEDSPLSAEGKERAKRLADVFKNAKVQNLISSKKIRTQQTLEPLAAAMGTKPEDFLKIGDLSAASAADVVKAIKGFSSGEVTVVCHHSTTVEPILQALGIPESEARTIDTSAFDNLILVLLPAGGSPQMVKLTYK